MVGIMKHIGVVFIKQLKDTFKNKTILIQFLMFPVLAVIMEQSISLEGMPEHFFVNLFAVMYCGMAPLTCMGAILSEEKEKNTLRVLMLSGVKPMEYLIGVGSYLWIICMLGACVFCKTGQYTGTIAVAFLLIMGVGILVSMLIGAAIGTWSRNQMMATSIVVPVMMVFSFLPMLSIFNESIERVARLTYSQQLHVLLNSVEQLEISGENCVVILINGFLAVLLFWLAYRKAGLA